MTTTVRYPVGKCWITVEAVSVKDAIRDLSEYADVFGEVTCDLCQGDQLRPVHRNAKGYDFYEVKCLSCGGSLSYGQTREGDKLFPKRRDQDGRELGKNGWRKYQPNQSSQPQQSDEGTF